MEVKSVLLPLGETLMIEIKHKKTGKVLCNINSDTLSGAYLAGANLSGANLSGAIGISIETNAPKSRDELVQDLLDASKDCLGLLEDWFPSMDDMRCASETDSKKIDRLKAAREALQ